MKLSEWARIVTLYKRSRRTPNTLLFKFDNARRLWFMWLSIFSTAPLVVLATCGYWFPALMPYAFLALPIWALALYYTRINALRTLCPLHFAEHAIDQSAQGKENTLCYAFFLDELYEQRYTPEAIQALSSYASVVGKPQLPALSQSIGFAALLALMVTLSGEVIKTTTLFTHAGWVTLILGSTGLYLYWIVWSGFQMPAYEKAWVKHYLDLASHDLAQRIDRGCLNVKASPENSLFCANICEQCHKNLSL